MKTQFAILKLLLAFTALVILNSSTCNKSDVKDECEATKWENAKILAVQPKLMVVGNSMPSDYHLKDAVTLGFFGDVRKSHCEGSLSEKYYYTTSHQPQEIDQTYWENGFYVGKVINFEFSNDKDYLLVSFDLIATFSDGKRYITTPPVEKIYPDEIFKDIDDYKNYFLLVTNDSDVWVQM